MQPTKKEIRFYALLETELSDSRSVIGKKHYLPFVVFSFILGLITLRDNRSSIHRYMENNFAFLCDLTGHKAVCCVSYTQLGRLLRGLDCAQLSALSLRYFGVKLDKLTDSEWIAGDGKDLKGSYDSEQSASRGDVLVRFVRHQGAEVVGTCFYQGNKDSEINAIRNLMTDNELDSKNVTLDALHCNPETTAQIAQKGGHYLVQVKEKHQTELVKDLTSKERRLPCVYQRQDIEKAHGRIEQRRYEAYHIESEIFDKRWDKSQLRTCIVVQRTTTTIKTGKQTFEKAFYMSNVWLEQAKQIHKKTDKKLFQAAQVCSAIRQHWVIEADNYVRDVTFGEDKCKNPKSKTAKSMAVLRSIAIDWLKLEKPKNFKERGELYRDCPKKFAQKLKKTKFIT
jgi:predicted transposase YbfD/YdcC